jgi:ABC-type transport system involved in cytochrome c biogenesis permease subunit
MPSAPFSGFVLLTAGLIIGVVYLKETHDVYFKGDTKVLWSLLVWACCLGLLVSRWRFAQRGRRLAWGAVGMFAFVLLTFWGSNLLSGIHNPSAASSPGTAQRP